MLCLASKHALGFNSFHVSSLTDYVDSSTVAYNVFCLFKILLNDAFLKGTVEINEFRLAFPLNVFQLVVHKPCWTLLSFFSLKALTNASRLL